MRPNLVPGVAVLLGGVGLAALWQGQINRAVALGAGFLPMLFPAWHNWHFGGVFIPISDNVTAWNVYVMSPADYVSALGELARLHFSGEHLVRAARQVMDMLSGPPNSWWLAPIHAVATAIVIRVVCSSRFEPMLRLTALAALALMPIALIYYVAVRYHLVMWFLMALVVAAWIKLEGLALLDRRRPQWRERWRRSPTVARTARVIDWLIVLRPSAGHERHRLDPVAVGIAHEGRVVAGGVFRTRPGRAVGAPPAASAAAWNASTARRSARAGRRACRCRDRPASWRGARSARTRDISCRSRWCPAARPCRPIAERGQHRVVEAPARRRDRAPRWRRGRSWRGHRGRPASVASRPWIMRATLASAAAASQAGQGRELE